MYKIIIYALVISSILTYFINSQTRIETLNRENAETESVLQGYKDANNALRSSITRQAALLEEARAASAAAEQQAVDAMRAFQNSDLNYLSQNKPELIERRINEGTRNVLTQIETITRQ